MVQIASFPLLSDAEFEAGCEGLVHAYSGATSNTHSQPTVELLSRDGTKYLRIMKPLVSSRFAKADSGDVVEGSEVDEDNDEELHTNFLTVEPYIEWDMIYSLSYRVPVIYFAVKDPGHRFPPTMETLHHIIPEHYQSEIDRVGIIGGITVTDHPILNTPVFFLHPCQTANVLAASVNNKETITPAQYLLLFLSTMGKYIQLDIPMSLAKRLQEQV